MPPATLFGHRPLAQNRPAEEISTRWLASHLKLWVCAGLEKRTFKLDMRRVSRAEMRPPEGIQKRFAEATLSRKNRGATHLVSRGQI